MTTVVAGRVRGASWRVIAFRLPEREQVTCAAQWLAGRRALITGPSRGEQPVSATFCQHPDSDASVLFGTVAEDVGALVVQPLTPVKRQPRGATIISAGTLGRFYAVDFEEPVESASVRPEPAEHFGNRATTALNFWLEGRRQNAESVELGRGATPAGGRWRMRLWHERADMPELQRVDFAMAVDDEAIERMYTTTGSGGYGGLAMPADQVIACRMAGGGGSDRHSYVAGELVPSVAHAFVRLDDGTDVEAQIVRNDVVPNDYFVAFPPHGGRVVAVVALDSQRRQIGQYDIDRTFPGWPQP